MAISDDPNARLIYCVSKGLVKTVHNIVNDNDIKRIQRIQPKVIEQAIKNILDATKSGHLTIEQINKQGEILTLLCNLPKNVPQPNPKVAATALAKYAEYRQNQLDEELTNLIPNGKVKESDWAAVFAYIQKHKMQPSQASIGYLLRVAGANGQWDNVKPLLSHREPDWRMAGELLFMAVKAGQLDVVKQLCDLSQENMPNVNGIKRALKEAKKEGHHEIASYLSCELIHQNNLEKDPLALTQALLQDYVAHSFVGSSLFSTQVKAVKNILSQVKRAAAQEHDDTSRNQAVLDSVQLLQKVAGDNKELHGYVDYIKAHCDKPEESPSLKAEL